MRFKGTIWLTVAFVGIVLYYFLVDTPLQEKQREEKDRAEKIILFDPGKVQEFSLQKKDLNIHLKRKEDNGWELLEPLKAKADQSTAQSFLTLLQKAKFSRVVEAEPKELSVYGLTQPSLTIKLTPKGQNEKTLLVGDESPMGDHLYVQRGGEKKVLLASLSPKSLEKSATDFRDKTILEFNNETVSRVSINNEGKAFDLVKAEKGWKIENSVTTGADKDEINRFLNLIKSSRVQEFIEEDPKSLQPFGLDNPKLQVTLGLGEEGKTQSLLVGGKKEERGYFGKTGKAKNIILLGHGLVDTLSKNPVDFMIKTLMEFDGNLVSRLNIRTENQNVILVKSEAESGRWKITEPLEAEADSATVSSLIFDLKDARVEEFVKISMQKPALFGLEKPEKELSIILEDGRKWSLQIGNASSDKKYRFASRSGDSTVFTISNETVEKLFRSLHDLRNKKLLDFKMDEIHRVSLEYPGKTFDLQRNKNDWDLLRPQKIKQIKAHIGNDILWTLNNLEFESIANPVSETGDTGFSSPSLTATLWDNSGKKIDTLTIGAKDKDPSQYFAKVDSSDQTYKIKENIFDQLPRDLKKFQS